MFCDEAHVSVMAGKGGDGHISFHREKFISKGGPDGGNGGHGGDIYFEAVEDINTLSDFRSTKTFKAMEGENGGKTNCYGRNAEDLVLKVPVGTIVTNAKTHQVVADLESNGQKQLIAKGGRGGYGNAHFASSIRQAPEFGEVGEPGEEFELKLELKLIADVAIIGMPSSGKSTLISRISNSRPKIADYPFTTLIPNLGVVDLKSFGGDSSESFVVVDVPGLIEGASEGKGLGHEFLKHIERAGFLVHLLDASLDNILENYKVINNELKLYSDILAKKQQVVVINKIDLIDKELLEFLKAELKKANRKLKGAIFAISGVTGEGIKELIFELWKKVKESGLDAKTRDKKEDHEGVLDYKIYKPHLEGRDAVEVNYLGEKKIKIERARVEKVRLTKRQRMDRIKLRKELRQQKKELGDDFVEEIEDTDVPKFDAKIIKIFEVKHKRFEQIVKMTNFLNEEAAFRVYDVMKKMRITQALARNGATQGDRVLVAGVKLTFKG